MKIIVVGCGLVHVIINVGCASALHAGNAPAQRQLASAFALPNHGDDVVQPSHAVVVAHVEHDKDGIVIDVVALLSGGLPIGDLRYVREQ